MTTKYRIVHVKSSQGCYFKIQERMKFGPIAFPWCDIICDDSPGDCRIRKFQSVEQAEIAIDQLKDCYQETIVKEL